LHKPDVLAVEEVASEDALKEVAGKLDNYTAIWRPSTDARHIAVGFLVKDGVGVTDVRQLGVTATTTGASCADDGVSNKLFERPPLQIAVKKGKFRSILIGNHWASQGHAEACRQAQAAFVNAAARDYDLAGGNVIVLGDLNDYEDSPALTQDLVSGDTTLRNLWSKAPATNRYSFQYQGQLQTLDHIFVNEPLADRFVSLRYVHFDNDYYERNDTTSPTGVSDHDPPVATFSLR
jgi:endonuclease/exonuclease/phosphatase family metal-dependent hydrolase